MAREAYKIKKVATVVYYVMFFCSGNDEKVSLLCRTKKRNEGKQLFSSSSLLDDMLLHFITLHQPKVGLS